MPKVIVGMSGGVDSSVTVHLLKELGYEVEGLSFVLYEARNKDYFTGCCSLAAIDGAKKTAASLDVKHTSMDVREKFIELVIEPFVAAYEKGLTPNPCILCNRHIKFPMLLRYAEDNGTEFIATGHYARVGRTQGKDGAVSLSRGVDPKKDQSYVLYQLRKDELRRLLLPLGDFIKEDVRRIARELGLEAADRPESQEICFVEDRDYPAFLEKLIDAPAEHGPILDSSGKTVGTHKGLYRYTIGQRKGLGIYAPEPCYVTRIDPATNTVHVGSRDAAMGREITVSELNWLSDPVENSMRVDVKIRSMMEPKPALIELSGESCRVLFDEPQWGPAPGQSAVFYNGDRVLGGGTIKACNNR